MSVDAWALLKAGAKDEALRHIKEAYSREGTPSRIIELGVAYLWTDDYQSAWKHLFGVIQKYPRSVDVFFGMAGTAKWCLREPREAVDKWSAGLDCQYTDMARVALPLLLYFASIVKPDVFSQDEAKRLLTLRATDNRIQKWPGAIAEFALGRIDEEALRCKCEGFNARDTALGHWKADFYLAIVERARGNVQRYRSLLQKCTTLSDHEFEADRNTFLGKLWGPEFFLARHELREDAR